MQTSWPIYYKNVLKVHNTNSPVGVATLWTEREVVKKLLAGTDYNVIGNLYSSVGISALIRNVYANPHIRTIILWGADLSRSGQAFVHFMKNGIDDDHYIIGDEKGGQIERDIPREAIDLFRKEVQLINLRGKSPDELKARVRKESAQKTEPFTATQTFPVSRARPFTYPSEQIGFRVSGPTVAVAWLRMLKLLTRYGRIKKTRYAQENELKELLNMMIVIENENIDDPYLPPLFPFSKTELLQYYPQVVSAKKIPGISYTYGQRLREQHGIDQVQELIGLIQRRPFSKKMVMTTLDLGRDWGRKKVDKGDTPCLTHIYCSVQDNKLFMTAHFRSHDMVHGWPRNIFALIKLQDTIAKEADVIRGPLCVISHSAHMYSDDYKLVEETLAAHYEKELPFTRAQHFEVDQRGNYTIEVEGQIRKRGRRSQFPYKPGTGEIVLKLYSPDGGLMLKEWRGKKAMDVNLQVTDEFYLSMPAHAMDLGSQIQRAEYAIKYGWEYSQDAGPNKM